MSEMLPTNEYNALLRKYIKRTGIKFCALLRTVILIRRSVQFVTHENFTIALLLSDANIPKVLGMGVAQKNSKDRDNQEIGRNIAVWRAFDNYYTDEEKV